MSGIIGKKLGMTSMYDPGGRFVACTLVEAGPCVVTQVKTEATDKYRAVQIAFGDKREKNTPSPMIGHFRKAGSGPKRIVKEFDFNPDEFKLGDEIKCELFGIGDFIDVVGTSKGKGFQGVVKRHGFAGVGGRTHGQHNRGRAPGSIGACSYPGRVFKGMRMGGRMGNERVMMQNLKILQVIPDNNLIVISGSIPGSIGSHVLILK